jgi:hypothetical protein
MGKTLALGRVGAGVGGLLAPGLLSKAFGLNLDANPQAGIYARMFGTRELMLAGAVLAGGPAAKGYAIKAGIGVDLGDAIGAVVEGKAGRMPGMSSKLVAAVALGAVAMGVMALSEE